MVIPSLSLLRIADFRRLGTAVALNSVGMMGETVVLGWLTLELTNSPFLVGVAMAMRSISLFFVGVPAGVLADRFPAPSAAGGDGGRPGRWRRRRSAC